MSALSVALTKVADALVTNAGKFEELDAAAGDGDLGITAGKIAGGIKAGLASATGVYSNDLMNIGREIAKAAPSTFGTLVATGFVRAAAVVSSEKSDLENIQDALTAAFDGVAARGKANLGERTLLDALHPAVEALKEALTLEGGIAEAAIAARRGVKATASMPPKHGRAGWIGDRANGLEDAGATVIAVAFESLI